MGTVEIVTSRAALRKRRLDLSSQGRTIVDGFEHTGSVDSPAAEVICVGIVDSADAAQDALLAGVAGASLVVLVDADAPTRLAFLEEVERIGTDPPASTRQESGATPPISGEDRTLVDLLAEGATVRDASSGAGMSVRTAHRRLSVLRSRFGAGTTAELLGIMSTDTWASDGTGSQAADAFGRESELRTCQALLAESRMVLVTGPAGIGKTALLRTLAAHDGRRILHGGGLRALMWKPYLPLTRAVGPLPPDADPAAVVHMVTRRAGGAVLVLDDLHWSDTATLAVLEALAQRLPIIAASRDSGDRAAELIERFTSHGAALVELAPLEEAAADALVELRRPELAPDDRRAIVRRADGNPLRLVEALAGPNPTLEARVAAALTSSSPPRRDALIRLALLGRPAGTDLLGEEAVALVESGLVRTEGDTVELRHDLIGEEILGQVEPADLRGYHSALAARLPAAEAARHHAAAGDPHAALIAALAAADDAAAPSERARHLSFAAQCVPSERVDGIDGNVGILLGAVDAFIESGELDEARSALDRLPAEVASADTLLRRARLEWRQGHPEQARAAVEGGLAEAAGTDTPVEVALRIEQLRFPIRVDFDSPRAVELARATVDLASRLGCEEARALTLLGSALLIDGSPDWAAAISRGLELARSAGDVDAEMEAANALTAAHLLGGDRLIARQVATEAWRSARSAHRRHWEEQFGVLSNLLALIAGDIAEVAEWGRDEVGPHLSAGVQLAYGTYAVALADLGRQNSALRTVREGLALDAGDATGTSLLRWAEAEAMWLLGQPATALVAAEESLSCAVSGFPVRPLAGAIRAWCQYDVGLPVAEADEDSWDFARAAKVESRGVSRLAAGDHAGAARCFEKAADLAGDAPRFSLRARWGLGETWRMAGEPERALEVMLGVHEAAQRGGFMALRGRSHRSLRRLGWGGDQAAEEIGPLTPRQREVLALVGQGRTTREIASILGIDPSTVDTHVRDAMVRLGATTRAQAALLLAESGRARGDPEPPSVGR